MFIHHPDGYFVIGGVVLERAVVKRFAPDYRLPDGAIGRIYEPGVRHFLLYPGRQVAQPLDWPEGDGFIASLPGMLRAMQQQQRRSPVDRATPVIQRKVRTYDRQQQKRVLSRIGGGDGRDADRTGESARSVQPLF